MLLDGENQCGEDLDDWFHFALNIVVSVIPIVCSKDGYGPKGYGYGGYGGGYGGYGGGYGGGYSGGYGGRPPGGRPGGQYDGYSGGWFWGK